MKILIYLFHAIGTLCFALSAQAGTPLWTFTPLTATTVSLPANGHVTVQYRVTNQSNKTRELRLRPLPAVTQVTTGPGVCGESFILAPQASCTLSLRVDGAQLTQPISDGPVVCTGSSALQCYRPALGNELRVTQVAASPRISIVVQPGTMLPDQVVTDSSVHAIYQITNNSLVTANHATIGSLPPHATIDPSGCGTTGSFTLAPGQSCTLKLMVSAVGLAAGSTLDGSTAPNALTACWSDDDFIVNCADTNDVLHLTVLSAPSLEYLTLMQDVLTNADLWSGTPEILSADYGFEGIAGVAEGQANVIAAGGTWQTISTPGARYAVHTTALTPSEVAFGFGYATQNADAIPVCLSWPVLPSTVSPSDFLLTLNTGQTVQPEVASISPNFSYNKRGCVTIFGHFGNRLAPGTPGAIYPTQLTIVDKGTTLKLVGPSGPVSAVGLTKSCGNSYQTGGGPKLIGAKLSVMNDVGQDAPVAFTTHFPNGGTALYASNAQYRLRLYTTAPLSPDGVTAILPTDFGQFFQVQVTESGVATLLTQTDIPYSFMAGTITVVGLADLGKYNLPLNDAYIADRDNYLDIILKGDEAAMRLVTAVIIPATGGYLPLYNLGGPGNDPTPGVTYTQPGPALTQPVTIAIDDPQTVNYP